MQMNKISGGGHDKPDNTIARFKARWVVKGYEQVYGIDYNQTYAGVVKSSAWRVILALIAYFDYYIKIIDTIIAFL